MVDISSKLKEIKRLVDEKQYFTINRPRQYGKTTTIQALEKALAEQYVVISMSFEGIGMDAFASEKNLLRVISKIFRDNIDENDISPEIFGNLCKLYTRELIFEDSYDFWMLWGRMCATAKKPIVLIIDEVDKESGNDVFLGLLGGLRDRYLKMEKNPTFHSVILAGVHDIKNLKLKIRPRSESRHNSQDAWASSSRSERPVPWNIAADFTVDMSFSAGEIASMLTEYENDHKTGMDVGFISREIRYLTSGYPFLVSRMCKIIDESAAKGRFPNLKAAWTQDGLDYAAKTLVDEDNTLFNDMIKQLSDFPELKVMLADIVFSKVDYPFNRKEEHVGVSAAFGLMRDNGGAAGISNIIFERCLFNYFLAEAKFSNNLLRTPYSDRSQFIVNGMLQMDLVMERFLEGFTQVYAGSDEKFLEEQGRRIFMTFLLPIIYGKGNMYIETQTQTKEVVLYKGVSKNTTRIHCGSKRLRHKRWTGTNTTTRLTAGKGDLNGTQLRQIRGSLAPRAQTIRPARRAADWAVRKNAAGIFERTRANYLQPVITNRATIPAPARSRRYRGRAEKKRLLRKSDCQRDNLRTVNVL
jgi:hypothetical protein